MCYVYACNVRAKAHFKPLDAQSILWGYARQGPRRDTLGGYYLPGINNGNEPWATKAIDITMRIRFAWLGGMSPMCTYRFGRCGCAMASRT